MLVNISLFSMTGNIALGISSSSCYFPFDFIEIVLATPFGIELGKNLNNLLINLMQSTWLEMSFQRCSYNKSFKRSYFEEFKIYRRNVNLPMVCEFKKSFEIFRTIIW